VRDELNEYPGLKVMLVPRFGPHLPRSVHGKTREPASRRAAEFAVVCFGRRTSRASIFETYVSAAFEALVRPLSVLPFASTLISVLFDLARQRACPLMA
jgi:hypothetical protein